MEEEAMGMLVSYWVHWERANSLGLFPEVFSFFLAFFVFLK